MIIDTKQSESSASSIEKNDSSTKEEEEEVLKLKPSQLPLMNQVRIQSSKRRLKGRRPQPKKRYDHKLYKTILYVGDRLISRRTLRR